jgi:hypothetical protein
MSERDYRRVNLHGQEVVLPSKDQWQEICLRGVLDGDQVPMIDWIQRWISEYGGYSVSQLGATRLRGKWWLTPMCFLGGRYYPVHFEIVVCEHCQSNCGASACPDTTAYAGTGLSTAEAWAEFDGLPIKACRNCGEKLRRRQTV